MHPKEIQRMLIMKMVKYYVLGALLALYLTWTVPFVIVKVLLGWIAFSLIAVSSAYLLNYPELFRKRQDGSIPIYIRWVFIPFLLGTGLFNEYARRTDKVPPLQKIDDNLFLACRMSGQHVPLMKDNGVNAILDVTAEFDGLDWTAYQQEFEYLNIPVLDHTSPTVEQLTTAINWVDQQIRSGKKVVIHCALGRGRSVLVTAAYLLARDDTLSIVDAMNKIQSIRSTARLNKRQLHALSQVKKGGRLNLNKSLVLVVNPVSGGGKWDVEKDEILSRLNPHFQISILETTPEISGELHARDAIHKGADIVVACGGDGTITEVASAVIGSDVTMGMIPLGTANALCQVLQGYMSEIMPISTACDIIINGERTTIDTAQCNDRLMLLVAAVGFEEQMISSASRDEKNAGGQLAYLQGLYNAITKNENLAFSLSLDDGESQQLETPSFVIANAAPLTTALAQGDNPPSITDGKVDITYLLPNENADRQLLSIAELMFSPAESKRKSQSIVHQKAETVSLTFPEEVQYAVDGEIFSASTITVTSKPQSLRVLASNTISSEQ